MSMRLFLRREFYIYPTLCIIEFANHNGEIGAQTGTP